MNSITISKSSIVPFLTNNPVIVEAGAHIGRDTLKMKKQWPQAVIHAFEPVPELYQQLRTATANIPGIFCYPFALAGHTGTATLHKSSVRSTATSSLLEPHLYKQEHPTTQFEPISVSTITLDRWMKAYTISHVDFLWLDMQGAELLVLQHATELLRTVTAIHTEVAQQSAIDIIHCMRTYAPFWNLTGLKYSKKP